ncbi:M14 family zinc carboxypeptidase [Halalkalicoccus jeotgali]|nr:M14 family zinc carboxypeptidase [Halalkalicoccus jeotgali]
MAQQDPSKAEDRFGNASINRRDFMRLSAVTAGALTLPGQAISKISSPKLTDLYEFAINHTPEDYGVGTLIRLTDTTAFDDLSDLDLQEYRQTDDGEPAAYAQLDNTIIENIIDIDTVVRLEFSPGANPFWQLSNYEPRVFPPAIESVDDLDFEETITGLQTLEQRHDDRLSLTSIGQSPGWFNHALGDLEPSDVWVAELTNDIGDEAAFADKKKVIYACSIHGDERSGAEAGTRFIERLLKGEESETEALLDDVVLIFLYPNPDGWNARLPQYAQENQNSAERLTAKRGSARVEDTNRQYPTAGWIDPAYFPAEPDGTNLVDDDPDIDDDVPKAYQKNVPDPLKIVEHFRDYENLAYAADLHEMGYRKNFALGLHVNTEYDLQQTHDIYELNRELKPRLNDQLGDLLKEREDVFQQYIDEEAEDPEAVPLPTEIPFDYGTITDTLGYQTTGILVSWMGHPEEYGGLGMQTLAYEIAGPAPRWPELMDLNVMAYSEVIRSLAAHALRDVEATVQTGGRSTAYVTTDTVTRSSNDLVFAESKASHTGETMTVGPEPTTMTVAIEENTRSVTFQIVERTDTAVVATLRDPDGTVRATYDSQKDESDAARMCITESTSGKWTVEVINPREEPPEKGEVAVVVDTVTSEPIEDGIASLDPRDILGYEQREYEVTPFSFLEGYSEFLDEGQLDAVSVADVQDGALLDDGQPAYDNLVVIHNEGVEDAAYTDALDAFVNADGNVLLTDSGVRVLAHLDNDHVSSITEDDIHDETVFSVAMNAYEESHPLRENARPIQRELYTPAPVGYPVTTEGDAPATVVDVEQFQSADGDSAGRLMTTPNRDTVSDLVVAGSIQDNGTGVHIVGGLLPPAFQEQLHPFGMLNHSVSLLGYLTVTNALGHKQRRVVDGEEVIFGETILTGDQAQVYYPDATEDEDE